VPKFDPRRIVDGQRMMQFLRPLPPTSEGKTFVLKSKVIGVYDKGKAGSVLETENLIMDKNTGEVRQRPSPWLGDENLLKVGLFVKY
jgi:peroxisomal enoyl-CoA hydratase 2